MYFLHSHAQDFFLTEPFDGQNELRSYNLEGFTFGSDRLHEGKSSVGSSSLIA